MIVVLIAYRTRGASFRWNLFFATLEHADWAWLGTSICLIILSNFGRAWRWKVMLRPLADTPGARPIGIWRLTSDTAIGLTAGVLLGRAGEVIRPYLIATQTGLPFSSQVAVWLLERMLDLLAIVVLCAYAFIQLPGHSGRLGPGIRDLLWAGGGSLAVAGAFCLVFLFLFRDPARRAQRRVLNALSFLPETYRERITNVLESFSRGVESTGNRRLLAQLLGYTVLEWTVIVASTFAVFRGFSATRAFSLPDVLVLFGFVTLGSVVQLPGIGGGAQAASIVILTGIYRIPLETASGVTLLLWIVGSLAVVPLGLACALHEGLRWGKLKLLSAKQIMEA